MAQVFKNNCASTLASGITDSALEMTLVDGSAFPDPGTDWYYVTLSLPDETDWEIVKVTAKATHVFTIVRGQESGSDARLAARAWAAGTRVSLRLTAGTLSTALTKLDGIEAGATAAQAVQSDVVGNVNYIGAAPLGSADDAAVWFITRLTMDAAGDVTTATATAVAWIDRLTEDYT